MERLSYEELRKSGAANRIAMEQRSFDMLGTELRRLAKALPCKEERSTEALWKSVAKQRKVIKIKYFKKEN